MYSRPIQQLISAFSGLPGVGPRTAERFVFYLLKSGKKEVGELTLALRHLMEQVKSCEVCWDFSDRSPCTLCADPGRNAATIAVVAEPYDLQAIERTRVFSGKYHVLRGTIDAGNEEIANLKIRHLLKRLADLKPQPAEVILALNPDVPGETTMMFIERQIREQFPHVATTRLARGLPMGSDLRYADDITLGSALKHRTKT